MRKVTIYVPTGSRFGDTTGYPTAYAAEAAVGLADSDWYPNGAEIVAQTFNLPDDAFWSGDLISVELHRGGRESDGISRGGDWTGPVCGQAEVYSVAIERGEVEGAICELGTDKPIQVMPLHAGRSGFPYRNAQLIAANEVGGYE